MSRLIDADALVNTLKGLRALANILSGSRERQLIPFDDMVRMIEKSPTIDRVWIPCSERLPEFGTYIVTVKQKYEFEQEWNYYTDVASYVSDDGYIDEHWDTFNDWIEGQETHVISWMPLPEPYRGEGEK